MNDLAYRQQVLQEIYSSAKEAKHDFTLSLRDLFNFNGLDELWNRRGISLISIADFISIDYLLISSATIYRNRWISNVTKQ